MKKSILAIGCISLLILVLSGCASKDVGESKTGKKSHTVTISTGEFHEFCDIYNVGDNLKFTFTSTKPVVFNVHYHTDSDKFYPIKDTLTDDFSGDFVVQTKDVHCAMWTNNNDKFVKVSFEAELLNK